MKPPFAALAVSLAVSLGLLAACGDDETSQSAQSQDVARYCEVSRQLDRAGEEQFRALEEDPNATPEAYEAAERALIKENQDLFEELQQVAPDEIEEEVETLLVSLRERAGIGDETVPRAEVVEAEQTIQAFDRENCTA